MDFRSKGKLAATAGLATVLALSPVVAPVATAFAADGNTETGTEAQVESEHTVTYWNETSYDDMTDATPYLVETVEHGKTHPRPDDPPARDGYKFEAWYSDKECTQRYNFRAVESDTDVYAGWTKDPTVTYYLSPESKEPFYTVTVDLDLSPDEQRELLNKSAAFEHLDVEIPEGYEFDGFYTTPDYSGSKFTSWGSVREDTTLYVKFKQTPVVTYDFQLEGVEDQVAEVYFGDYADPMTYDGNEGYVIAGWYTDPGCTEEYDFTEPVMGDMTLYAKWDQMGNTMHRLYNPFTGEHFYTADEGEFKGLVAVGWKDEGRGWTAPEVGAPVYRLYNPYVPGGDHHYTLSWDEVETLRAAGWEYEGVGWKSAPADTGVPLYRQYNPFATTGTHNYTTSKEENDRLVDAGWREEGVAWYGV